MVESTHISHVPPRTHLQANFPPATLSVFKRSGDLRIPYVGTGSSLAWNDSPCFLSNMSPHSPRLNSKAATMELFPAL